jgi:Ni/Fe-hydrogenase 1 B-type cytochrome subunit
MTASTAPQTPAAAPKDGAPISEPPRSTAILPRFEESHVKEIETRGVLVYGWGLRTWHWATAGSIVTLAITGYLIGSPLPSIGGEASEHFMFGTIRFLHFAAGMLLSVGFLFRIGLAAIGRPLHREIFLPRVDKRRFRHDFVAEAKWYMFLRNEPNPAVGHNPIAQVVMFGFFTLPAIFMIVTGLSLYAEGAGQGSTLDSLFGWVGPALGGSQAMHTYHHVTMWALVVFVILHVYAVMREDVLGGQSTLSVIVSGYRYFRGKGHFHDEDDTQDMDEDK